MIFGQSWETAVDAELARLGVGRVFVLASAGLATGGDLAERTRARLGDRLAGFMTGIGSHTPVADVIEASARARHGSADFILAVGGGSVIDAGKMVLFCLAEGVLDAERLIEFAQPIPRPPTTKAALGLGAISSTLSGAEFTAFAGATDSARRVKQTYAAPFMLPEFVVLDPLVTTHTPSELWMSTGIRALDHAIEGFCSPGAHPLSEAASYAAIIRLARSLPLTRAAPMEPAHRLDSQCGVWLAAVSLQSGVYMGASHGIGHALGGSAGVPHGITSCVMLPHVLRWNKAVNGERQDEISTALGMPGADAGDLVAALVKSLGLPGRLRDVGVERSAFPRLAGVALEDQWTRANPRPIASAAAIAELLDLAW